MQEEEYEYYDEDSVGGEGDKSTAANESYPHNQSVVSNFKVNTSAAATAAASGGSKASSLADRFRKGTNPAPIIA